jgi:hypothetical protein
MCVELNLHSPNTSSWRSDQLKHRDNFTFAEEVKEMGREREEEQEEEKESVMMTVWRVRCTMSLTYKKTSHKRDGNEIYVLQVGQSVP